MSYQCWPVIDFFSLLLDSHLLIFWALVKLSIFWGNNFQLYSWLSSGYTVCKNKNKNDFYFFGFLVFYHKKCLVFLLLITFLNDNLVTWVGY